MKDDRFGIAVNDEAGNAVRFSEMNGCVRVAGFDPDKASETLNRWIVTEVRKTQAEVSEALDAYRFNDAAGAIYRFVWNSFCDWYLEFTKPVLTGDDGSAKDETRATCAWVIDEILKVLHPFMPFITEELWAKTGEAGPARDIVSTVNSPVPSDTQRTPSPSAMPALRDSTVMRSATMKPE